MPPKGKDAKGGKAKEKSGGDEGGSKGKGGKGGKGGAAGDLGTCTFVKGYDCCHLALYMHSVFIECNFCLPRILVSVSTLNGYRTCETSVNKQTGSTFGLLRIGSPLKEQCCDSE